MIPQYNSPLIDTNVYNGTSAFTVQDYTEANSKNGTQYEGQLVFPNILASSTRNFIFKTGDNPVIVKFRVLTGEYSDITYTIYRDTVFTPNTPIQYGNLNDIIPVTGTVEIYVDPTVTSLGTFMPPAKELLGSGLNKTISYGTPEGERILKPNTNYGVTITNNSQSSTVPKLTIDFGWYEGPIDFEIRGD